MMRVTSTRRAHNGEQGFALVAFALSMTAFFALAAVAIDIGRIAHTANEVQNVADAAATAGATNLMNGGTASGARADAQAVVAQNMVAGSTASIQTSDLQVGQYDPTTNVFTNGATPPNAVKATPSTTVQNLFAGFFGSSYMNTTVSKSATAGFSGIGQAAPTLPLVIRDCEWQSISACVNSSCLPPPLTLQPDGSNSCWSSLTTPNAAKGTVEQYFPSVCHGTQTPPTISVADSVNLTNGTVNQLVNDVADCLAAGMNTFVVPIVACSSNCNQSAAVTGFATVQLSSVNQPAHTFTINWAVSDISGPAGGQTYGTGSMRLYN
jgi:Flp pilus assembly protein TadG